MKALTSLFALLIFSSLSYAQQLTDDYTSDFLWGKPYIIKKQESEKKTDQKKQETPKDEVKVDAELLRDQLPKLLDKAWSNPTIENVTNYRTAQKILTDKSTRFAESWEEVNQTNPFLSENNSVPIASMGAVYVRQIDSEAQQEAMRELAKHSGLFVFVDSQCKYCGIQLKVIQYLKSEYKMDSLIVSIDGSMPKGFEKYPFVVDNGLYRRLKLQLTPVTVLVIKPDANKVEKGVDNNKYVIVSYGFYAVDQMVKNISYAAFKSKALSKEVAQKMNPWNYGVASSQDLNGLTVGGDMNFTKAYQPILEKAFKNPPDQGQAQ